MPFGEVLFPRLMTVCTGPLSPLETVILNKAERIEAWFHARWQEMPAPMTSSVDLRYAGFKLAPVDTNLFPAGFNNLHPESLPLCSNAVRAVLLERMPTCRRVLILPESHTRNVFYLRSLCVMRDRFVEAGFLVRVGSLDPELTVPIELQTEQGDSLWLEPLVRKGDRVGVVDFDPCLLVLNHDLSTGIPPILEGLAQPIHPTSQLGWGTRLKSSHFSFFDQVADAFAREVALDPWLINPLFCAVEGVDFMQQTGLDALAVAVDDVLARLRSRYHAHGIAEKPFVVVKADNGTYGMGVMTVHEGAEVLQLNRKQRTKMSARKGSQKVTSVLIQEGVYSVETMPNGAVAEPVIYLIGPFVVGAFYRGHHARGPNESLNTPGMYFEPLAFDTPHFEPYGASLTVDSSNRFYVYGVIARLAALAAAWEIVAIGGKG